MATQVARSRIALDTILLATDFSPESENALKWAVALAKRYEARLVLAHAVTGEANITAGEMWPQLNGIGLGGAVSNMCKLEQNEDLSSLPHDAVVQSGDVWEVLAPIVTDRQVDLIVMGTHGSGGLDRLILGSTAEKVIRHALCPVITVGPRVRVQSASRFSNILFATDFSVGSLRALTYALSLALEDRAELTMLHIIESKPMSQAEMLEWRRQDRERLLQLLPPDLDLACRPEIEIEAGVAAREILLLAETRNADLIVMGSHPGGNVSTHLPWTTLHHVLQRAPCPVLTVRSA